MVWIINYQFPELNKRSPLSNGEILMPAKLCSSAWNGCLLCAQSPWQSCSFIWLLWPSTLFFSGPIDYATLLIFFLTPVTDISCQSAWKESNGVVLWWGKGAISWKLCSSWNLSCGHFCPVAIPPPPAIQQIMLSICGDAKIFLCNTSMKVFLRIPVYLWPLGDFSHLRLFNPIREGSNHNTWVHDNISEGNWG